MIKKFNIASTDYGVFYLFVFFAMFFFTPRPSSFAQEIKADTIATDASSKKLTPDEKKDSATTASNRRANKMALMSSVVPGLGQAMNKKYWKVPVIYAGGITLAYFIVTNNSEYHKFQKALIQRNDKDSTTVDDYSFFTNEDLTVRKDYYRRNRDLCYILAGILYTLNIVDAYVDSQLLNFDVSDDITLNIQPSINLSQVFAAPSLNFVLNFK